MLIRASVHTKPPHACVLQRSRGVTFTSFLIQQANDISMGSDHGVSLRSSWQVVADAVTAALEDHRFDFRANVFTLIAITGVILYWRGVWTLWCVISVCKDWPVTGLP